MTIMVIISSGKNHQWMLKLSSLGFNNINYIILIQCIISYYINQYVGNARQKTMSSLDLKQPKIQQKRFVYTNHYKTRKLMVYLIKCRGKMKPSKKEYQTECIICLTQCGNVFLCCPPHPCHSQHQMFSLSKKTGCQSLGLMSWRERDVFAGSNSFGFQGKQWQKLPKKRSGKAVVQHRWVIFYQVSVHRHLPGLSQ